MSLLSVLFKTKKLNFFEKIANEIAKEEKKKVLLESPFLDQKLLEFDQNGILSFVIATFCMELEKNPKLQLIRLKKEYIDFIEQEKKTNSFQLIYKSMNDYYNGTTGSAMPHWKITYAYLESTWKIKERIKDPTLITAYSVYLTQLRVEIKKQIEGSLPELIDK